MHFDHHIIPAAVQPILFNVVISTVDIEFYTKMTSLILSMCYLIYRWRIDIKKNKKQ